MNKLLLLLFFIFQLLTPADGIADNNSQEIQVRGDKDFAPFEYLDENGVPAGFDIDILKAVADVMNLNIDLSLGPWDEVRTELELGRIDVLAGMRYSEDRDLTLDFSAPYLINTSAIFARLDSSIHTLEDLKGKEVIIQRGDIMDDYIQSINLAASIVFVSNQTEALKLLASGKHDAALCSRLLGLYLVNQLELENITIVGQELAGGPYGFAVTDGNQELLAQLNEGLRILKATDRYDDIYRRWFGLYEQKNFNRDLYRYAIWVLGPFLLLLFSSMLWSWTLKRKIALKTRELGEQLEKRQQAEAHLESERRFRQLIEASPVPMVTIGNDRLLLYVNNKFSELFGYTLEELSDSENWWALACPDQHQCQAVLETLNERMISDQPSPSDGEPFEVDITCRDGSIRHVVCRHAAIDEHHVLVFNDITKRKQAEKALEERIRIEAMISSLSARFINLSPLELDEEINRALKQIGLEIGVDRSYVFEFNTDNKTMSNTHEWCAENIEPHLSRLQNIPKDRFPWFLQELSEDGFFYCPSVDELGPEAQAEKQEWQQEGIQSLIIVSMHLKGEMVGFTGFDSVKRAQSCSREILFLLRLVGESFANALERRRVEYKLRAAHQRLQDIIDFLPDATFVIDKQGTVVAWNRAIEKLTDVPKQQMLGLGEHAYSVPFYGERRPSLIDLILDPGSGRKENYQDLQWDHNALFAELYLPALYGGKGAYVWAKASPLYDRDGKFTGAIESIRDISDRKEAQEKLEASYREMEAFVYTVSHDLRSPLTPIIGFAEFVSDNYQTQLDDLALNCLSEISNAGIRMLGFMEDLLDLAKVGHLDPPEVPVDTREVVQEVLANLSRQIDQTEAKVKVETLPKIRVPRTFLYQIFSNLVGNAIHYAGKQGSPIEIGGEFQSGTIRFCVRDHGPGIPDTERERVFDAFYRGSSGMKFTGTGVGLATVQKIARLYGGRAMVEDTPGGGATFWVEMQEEKIKPRQKSEN